MHPSFLSSLRPIRDLLLLSLWGFCILWLSYRGLLGSYLHPSLQPYTLGSGVFLLILAAFATRRVVINGKDSPGSHQEHHDCCTAHDHHGQGEEIVSAHVPHSGHSHDHSSDGFLLTVKTFLLLLPLVMICCGQGTKYSISTVQNRGVVQDLANLPSAKPENAPSKVLAIAISEPSARSTPSLPSPEAMPIQVIDLLYAVQMPSYREEFVGKDVEMVAQFVPLTTGNPKGDRFQAIRLFMTCCAADAKPVGVTVKYNGSLKFSEMGWIRITGVPTFPMEGGHRTAILEAKKVEECAAPDEPFVY